MEMSRSAGCAAVHQSGGNFLDDVRVDLAASYVGMAAWNSARPKMPPPIRTALGCWLSRQIDRELQARDLTEFLVGTGLRRAWFHEFLDYWSNVVRGRPITVSDFMLLLYDYRKKVQNESALDWASADRHVANWQHPAQIYYIFHFCRKYALQPVRIPDLRRWLKPRGRVLEYGCALAPAFRDYRAHHRDLDCRWVLADIPNFPFHYATYTYGADPDVEAMPIIAPERFQDPLAGLAGDFDLIILQEVFEHLDDPLFVARYLFDRLKPGGLILFDYIQSEGTGLDTPRALAARSEVLQFLAGRLEFEAGRFAVDSADIGQCVGRKRA